MGSIGIQLLDASLKGESLHSSDRSLDHVMGGLKHALTNKQRVATCWYEDAALASFGRQVQAEGPVSSVNSCVHYDARAIFL